MPNRLAHESSPYLLQHQNNPVDWYPWGPEALARSKAEDRPIFLSIGYSACHWCHVMEHESFENAEIAALMNELFVCIKVDREERPDLDQIYMTAVQLMTGRGGWPMSVFLTPDLHPFFGGTYWPPRASRGMPGFDLVLTRVAEAWKDRRQAAVDQALQLTAALQQAGQEQEPSGGLRIELLQSADAKLERAFDFTHGGFGSAPKFPHSMDLQVLLRTWQRKPRPATLEMVTLTLDKMAQGGIYDHLGGGFARYSVDERWLVPHFEKMLYDNALLTTAFVETFQATQEDRFAQVARETCDYILRDMTDPAGGFYSTEDADSEGEEGKFYVWKPAEIVQLLGTERGERFCSVYNVTPRGNFEHGTSILNLPKTIAQCASLLGLDVTFLAQELAESREILFAHREERIHPGKDDKVLVSWNGLMIDALARAGAALNEPRYVAAAQKGMAFLLTALKKDEQGRLFHCWRHGVPKVDAFVDDYAAVLNAAVTLFEVDGDPAWLASAKQMATILLRHFHDPAAGGFFYTADDQEQLISRSKDSHDSSVPSGNGLAATGLLRLGKLTGERSLLEAAEGTLRASISLMERAPSATGQLLIATDLFLGPTHEIVLCGDLEAPDLQAATQEFHRSFIPRRVFAQLNANGSPRQNDEHHLLRSLSAGKKSIDGQATTYICQDFACSEPAVGLAAARSAWQRISQR